MTEPGDVKAMLGDFPDFFFFCSSDPNQMFLRRCGDIYQATKPDFFCQTFILFLILLCLLCINL